MLKDAIYGGVNAAVVTPMRDDLSVDLDKLAAHARWLLANGCNNLGVLGTTGEANSLSISERLAVLDGLAERGIAGRHMLPGTGTPAFPDTVLLTRKAAEIGCPGVLVLPPFFYKNPSEEGLFASYSEIIERTGGATKIFFYHFPAQSAVPITLSLIGRLLKRYPGVVKGIKDSSGDFANTKSYVDAFVKDGFEVYCGDDSALLALLQAGGAGCITAAANVGSVASAAVYGGWDAPAGEIAQKTLSVIRTAVGAAGSIAGVKALVARNTGDETWLNVRPPNGRLSKEAAERLFAAFDASGHRLAKAA